MTALHDGLTLADTADRFVFVNPAYARLLGTTPEALLGTTPFDVTLPEDHATLREAWARSQAGATATCQTRLRRTDGSVVSVRVDSMPWWQDGELVGTIALIIDLTAEKAAAAAAEAREAWFRALVQNIADILLIIDNEGRIQYVNPAAQRTFGYPPGTWLGRGVLDLVHPEDLPRALAAAIANRSRPGTAPPLEVRVRHADGSWRHVEAIANNLLDDPAVRGIIQTVRDITPRREAEAALRASEERFRALVQHAIDLIVILDAEGMFRYVSPSIERIGGYRAEELLGRHMFELIHPDDRATVMQGHRERLANPGVPIRCTVRLRHKDGSWRFMEGYGTNYLDHPAIDGIVFNSRDMTETVRLTEQLRALALHDELTGLPNRRLLMERLSHALEGAARRPGTIAILFLDLDGFKEVNDRLGHSRGDMLLRMVAERLQGCLRPVDTVARMGGDEFVILLEDLATPDDAITIAERVLAACRAPFVIDGEEIIVSTSIGLAFSAGGDVTADDLLQEADAYLYQAKVAGKGRYRSAMFDSAPATPVRGSSASRRGGRQ